MRFFPMLLPGKLMRRAIAAAAQNISARIEPLEERLNFSAPTFMIGAYLEPDYLLHEWAQRGVNTAFEADLQGATPNLANYAAWSQTAVGQGLSIIRPPANGLASTEAGQSYLSSVAGWLQPDEPDDLPGGSTTSTTALAANYSAWSSSNGSDAWRRPVYLNFDGGEVNGIKGAVTPSTYYPVATADGDILGNDMYPITGWDATGDPGADNGPWIDLSKSTTLQRYTVGTGTGILKSYAPNKSEFAVIETGNQYLATLNPTDERGVTPAEFRGEVWDAIIKGATGIVYFSHIPGAAPSQQYGYGPNFQPPFSQDDDTPANVATEMITQNARITSLANVLVSSTSTSGLSFSSSTTGLEGGIRRYGGQDYFIGDNLSSATLTNASMTLNGEASGSTVTVNGETRSLTTGAGGSLTDTFQPYEVHIYALTPTGTAPAAPSNVVVTTASNTALTITWADNSSNETSFLVQRSTTLNGTYTNAGSVGANTTTFSDTGLGVSVTYYYKVSAVNAAGPSAPAIGVGETSVPNAPWGLTVGSATNSTLNLSWFYNTLNNTSIVVARGTSASGPFTPIATLAPNALSYNDSGLTAGTTYYYQVSAVNAVGSGTTSGSGATTSSGSAPLAPTNLVLTTLSNTSIGLAWSDNANNETSYIVQRSATQNGTYSTIVTLAANSVSYTDSGLGVSVVYFYHVYASNSVGPSGFIAGESQTSVPNSPWGLSIGSATASTLNLSWFNNSVNNTSMVVARSTSSSGPFSPIATLAPTALAYNDSGLAAGTTYYYQVSAVNAVGSGTTSGSGATTSAAPAAPSNFNLRTASNSGINLSWSDNANNETSYIIQRSTTLNGTYSTIVTLAANSISYSDTGLSLSANYYYKLYANNASGNSAVVSGSSATSVPNGPYGLAVSANSSSSLHLSWFDTALNETNFIVTRSTSLNGTYSIVATLGANITTWDDSGLSSNTTYYYKVYATNDVGNSGTTNASGTTNP